MKFSRLIAVLVGVAALMLIPAYASASTVGVTLQVNGVAPDGSKVTGVVPCGPPEYAGKTVDLVLGGGLPADKFTPGNVVGVIVETSTNTIVGMTPPPCQPGSMGPVGPGPGPGPGPGGPDYGCGGKSPAGEMPPPPPPGDAQTSGAGAPPPSPPGGGEGEQRCGGGSHDFARGFLNRVWKFEVDVDAYEDDQLDVTMLKILNLPKKFKDQDDELLDQAAIVLIGKKTKVVDGDGKRVSRDKLGDADKARVYGKLLPPKKWRKDEDDQETPTIRAKKVILK